MWQMIFKRSPQTRGRKPSVLPAQSCYMPTFKRSPQTRGRKPRINFFQLQWRFEYLKEVPRPGDENCSSFVMIPIPSIAALKRSPQTRGRKLLEHGRLIHHHGQVQLKRSPQTRGRKLSRRAIPSSGFRSCHLKEVPRPGDENSHK